MIAVRIIRVITGVAGLGALTLGLLFWIAQIDFISLHMLFGLIVALSLLILGIVGVFTRGLRLACLSASERRLSKRRNTDHVEKTVCHPVPDLQLPIANGSAVSWLLSLLHKVSTRGKVGLMRANIIYTLGRLFASVRSPFSQSYKINLPCSQVSVNATQARYRTE